MNTLIWTSQGLIERQGDLQVCVFPYTSDQIRVWLDNDYRVAVRAITALPERYRVAIAVGVAATYEPYDAWSSYVVHLLRWSKACPSCVACGGQPARKAAIGGIADWRCAAHEREARAIEQQAIRAAVAKGNAWLRARMPAVEVEPDQVRMFELMEDA